MSIFEGFIGSVLAGVISLLSTALAPASGEQVSSSSELLGYARMAYNNSPRSVEEANFSDFVKKYDLKSFDSESGSEVPTLREVMICKNDDTFEKISV